MTDFKAHDLYNKKNNHYSYNRNDDYDSDKTHKKINKFIIFLAIITLAVTAVLFFTIPMIFNNIEDQFISKGIGVVIDGPLEAVVGTKVNYKIIITNNESVSIKDVYLLVNYGNKFQFTNSNPVIASGTESGTWFLDSLNSGETRAVDLSGVFSGDTEVVNTFTAIVSYEPLNFRSKFTKQTRLTTKIVSSAYIDLVINGPNQVLLKDQIVYDIVYKNLFTEPIKEAEILVDLGDNFNIESKEPQSTYDNIWLIKNIESSLPSSIRITGKSKTIGKNDITATAKIKDKNNVTIEKVIKLSTDVIEGRLKLDLILNGSNDGSVINSGDVLNYSVVYQNQDVLPMKDVKIVVTLLPSILIDWSSFKSDTRVKIEDNKLVWSKDEIPNLALLTPNTSSIIDFQFKIQDFKEFANLVDYNLSSIATAEIYAIGDTPLNASVKAKEIFSPLNADVTFNAYVRYFNDDNLAIGSGPVPPKVGNTTTYKIFFIASVALHNLENVTIKAKLPDYVSWQNKYNISAGNLYYDKNNNIVYWNISKIPTGVIITADLDVSITPNQKDANKILVLLENVKFSGTDQITSSKIEKNIDPLTTFLDTDPVMRGRGVVIE